MTPIAEIRAALAAATPGPWRSKLWLSTDAEIDESNRTEVEDLITDANGKRIVGASWYDGMHINCTEPDATLIAASPTWLAELCDRVERAERLLDNDWAYNAIQDGIAGLPPEVGCNGGSRSVACLRAAYEREKCRAESAEAKRAEVERERDSLDLTLRATPAMLRAILRAEPGEETRSAALRLVAERDAAIAERDALGESLTTLVYWHDRDGIDESWWVDARQLLSTHAKASGGEHG